MHAGRALPAGVRLIAIAKERLGHETFVRDHWNSNGGMRSKWAELDDVPRYQSNPFEAPFPTPELFFDTWKGSPLPGRNPLFRVCNGASQKWTGVLSYLVGGEVAVNSALTQGVFAVTAKGKDYPWSRARIGQGWRGLVPP